MLCGEMAEINEQVVASETSSSENSAVVATDEKGERVMEPSSQTAPARRSLRGRETHPEVLEDDALPECEDVEKGEKVHAKEEFIDVERDSEPEAMTAPQDAQDLDLLDSESNASQSEQESVSWDSDSHDEGENEGVSKEGVDEKLRRAQMWTLAKAYGDAVIKGSMEASKRTE